jgi:hypothetical protein
MQTASRVDASQPPHSMNQPREAGETAPQGSAAAFKEPLPVDASHSPVSKALADIGDALCKSAAAPKLLSPEDPFALPDSPGSVFKVKVGKAPPNATAATKQPSAGVLGRGIQGREHKLQARKTTKGRLPKYVLHGTSSSARLPDIDQRL